MCKFSIYSHDTNTLIDEFEINIDNANYYWPVLNFLPHSNSFLLGCNKNNDIIYLLNIDKKALVTLYTGGGLTFSDKLHNNYHFYVFRTPDKKSISLIDNNNLTEIGKLEGHNDNIKSIRFGENENHGLLITSSKDKTVCIWDAKEKKEKIKFLLTNAVYDAQFKGKDKVITLSSGENDDQFNMLLHCFDINTKNCLYKIDTNQNRGKIPFDCRNNIILSIKEQLKGYNSKTGELIFTIKKDKKTGYSPRHIKCYNVDDSLAVICFFKSYKKDGKMKEALNYALCDLKYQQCIGMFPKKFPLKNCPLNFPIGSNNNLLSFRDLEDKSKKIVYNFSEMYDMQHFSLKDTVKLYNRLQLFSKSEK